MKIARRTMATVLAAIALLVGGTAAFGTATMGAAALLLILAAVAVGGDA